MNIYNRFAIRGGFSQAIQIRIVCAEFGAKPQFRVAFTVNKREFSFDVLFQDDQRSF